MGNEEEQEEIYTSPFMRRRRTRLQTANQHNHNGYDSDGYSLDEFNEEDQGTSLLGALSYIIYGRWQQIFDDLTNDEKIALKLVKEEEDEEDDNDNDEKMEN